MRSLWMYSQLCMCEWAHHERVWGVKSRHSLQPILWADMRSSNKIFMLAPSIPWFNSWRSTRPVFFRVFPSSGPRRSPTTTSKHSGFDSWKRQFMKATRPTTSWSRRSTTITSSWVRIPSAVCLICSSLIGSHLGSNWLEEGLKGASFLFFGKGGGKGLTRKGSRWFG